MCSTRCAPGTPRWEYGTARDPNTRREPQWPGSRKRTVLRIVLSVQEEGVTHFIGTTTKPGQTEPGQDKTWTRHILDRHILDRTYPGQDISWTGTKPGHGQNLDRTKPRQDKT